MIFVIIPVHNRKEFTRGCLTCLSTQTYRDFITIVIDDGSTDGTSKMIKDEFPEVIVLLGDGNLWWTKAINKGVKYALEKSINNFDDAILTLNDDLIFDNDYINNIAEDFRSNQPCLMGSVVVDIKNPKYLEYAGGICNYYTAKGNRISRLFNNDYEKLANEYSIVRTDELSGRGTLIPIHVFNQLGLYDDINFPHYMADIEFSVRARRTGYNLFISVDSVISNYMEATRNKRQSIRDFLTGFISFKSPYYLKARYAFAVRHTPFKIIYFGFDISRLLISYILKR